MFCYDVDIIFWLFCRNTRSRRLSSLQFCRVFVHTRHHHIWHSSFSGSISINSSPRNQLYLYQVTWYRCTNGIETRRRNCFTREFSYTTITPMRGGNSNEAHSCGNLYAFLLKLSLSWKFSLSDRSVTDRIGSERTNEL